MNYSKRPPRSLCICGCGEMVRTWDKERKRWCDFKVGHYFRGVNGYESWKSDRYKNGLMSRNGKRIKRGNYPSYQEIIKTHLNFLLGIKIDPEKCWACQSTNIMERAHICSVSDGGDNVPDNLVLLCYVCHACQHIESLFGDWDKNKQYEWLINMQKKSFGERFSLLKGFSNVFSN